MNIAKYLIVLCLLGLSILWANPPATFDLRDVMVIIMSHQ